MAVPLDEIPNDWSVLRYVRRALAPMTPPTITDKMMLPMIEILIGEPISANTILCRSAWR